MISTQVLHVEVELDGQSIKEVLKGKKASGMPGVSRPG
jgi:hypothetical protein